jgi:sugar phosphate permease
MAPTSKASDKGRHRLFRGWWIVVVAIVAQCFSLPAMLGYTFGVFAKPLADEFHTNRAAIALAVSLLDVVLTLSAPAAGRLVDRYSARRVIVTSLVALATCLIGLSLVKPPLWHFYALYVLAGLVGIGTTPVTYSRVVANWFDRKRGLALGLASTGIGLGVFIAPSLAQFLIDRSGWRQAYLGLACACLTIAVPVVGIFFTKSPEDVGLLPDGAAGPGIPARSSETLTGMKVFEALRRRTFWQLCGVFFCVAACVNGGIAHLVPLLTDRGLSGRSAVLATSFFGAASIAGRVANGYLVDRIFAPFVSAIFFAGAAAGVGILWRGATGGAAFLAAALLGLAIGAESDVMPFLVSRYFGMRSMAELFGCVFGSYTLGTAAGRYLFAAGFDATGSYTKPLSGAFVLLMLAVIVTLGLGKYHTHTGSLPTDSNLLDQKARSANTARI